MVYVASGGIRHCSHLNFYNHAIAIAHPNFFSNTLASAVPNDHLGADARANGN